MGIHYIISTMSYFGMEDKKKNSQGRVETNELF